MASQLRFLASLAVVALLMPGAAVFAHAQEEEHGRLVLVQPIENLSGQTALDWIGEAVPEIINPRLASAGFLTISRTDRLYALDHLGLPLNFRPSRATTLRIAQTLDANYVLTGSYALVNGRLTVTLQILDVQNLHLGKPLVTEEASEKLLDILNSSAWKVARELDPKLSIAEETFLAANANLRLDAFENYVRGLSEPSAEERLKHLKLATQLGPGYTPAWLALGKAYYASEQFELAATTFARIPKGDPAELEALFYRGLSQFNAGIYARAEESFTAVAKVLPLPEVVNNQGVAASRHGRDGSPQFLQAIQSDPNDADYHYNLAVSLKRHGDAAGSAREVTAGLNLRPSDTGLQQLSEALNSHGAINDDPLERIKRSYNEAGYRQAALQLEEVQEMRLANLPAKDRSAEETKSGDEYLNRGLMLEAEREYQLAAAADSTNPLAQSGLAAIRERSGDTQAARKLAQQSLLIAPNAPAYLVLARVEQGEGNLDAAAHDVANALQLDKTNPAALGMRQALEARGQHLP